MAQAFSLTYWFRRSKSVLGLAKKKKIMKEKEVGGIYKKHMSAIVFLFSADVYKLQVILRHH